MFAIGKSSLLVSVLWCCLLPVAVRAQSDEPTPAALRVAEEIRSEALLPPNGPEGRPLPLASHWNTGRVKGTFEPEHQIALLQAGHHILPWMSWPGGEVASPQFQAYYGRLLSYFSALKLPISFRGTQWPAMLIKKSYRNDPSRPWAGVITPSGERKAQLSPFGDIAPWKDPARAYVDTPAMKWVQEVYPDPPLVLWVSNNESPTLRWQGNGPLEERSKRYLDLYGEGRSDEFKRKVMGSGWIARNTIMFDAMREALVEEAWRENVRFVGYGVVGPSHFGRWNQWKVHSLVTDEWVSPGWYFWDGGSPSYYTHNWNDNRDYWVFSTQVEAMNWVFMLEEAWKVNPDFWFEFSAWDGNHVNAWMQGVGASRPGELAEKSSRPLAPEERLGLGADNVKKSKALQYLLEGQSYPPERAAGWIQFGMWLLRPRVVREFRSHATPLEPVEPYWMEIVKAVDRVYADDTLKAFWRHGTLVSNPAHEHPYQAAIPKPYRDIPRWYLLDTNLDPRRPWSLHTPLPVFSLALVRGEQGRRRWLLYAHAPVEDQEAVQITIPDYQSVTVDVPRAGAFYLVEEATGQITSIGPPSDTP